MTADRPPSTNLASFEDLKLRNGHGAEYWSARDLQPLLGYRQWRRFEDAIGRAVTSCEQSGNEAEHHFAGAGKMIGTGKGAVREVEDTRRMATLANRLCPTPVTAIGAVGVLSRARLVQNIELPRPALVRALSTATSIRLFEGLAGMHETQLAKAVTPIAARKLSPVQPALAHAALTL